MAKEAEYEQLIVKHLDNIVYVSDPVTYELLYLNEKGKKAFQIEDNKYQGQKCYKLLQGKDSPCEFCTNHLLNKQSFYQWTHFNVPLNRYFMMNDKLIEIEPGHAVRLEIAVDITESEKRAQDLEQRLTTEETLLKCVQTLSAYNDQQAAINELLNIVAAYYQGQRVYIFEINYDNDTISNTYEWCAEGVSEEIQNLKDMPIDTISRWLAKFEKFGEFYITSVNETLNKDSEEYRILAAQGIKSLIAAPLSENDVIIGFIGVDDPIANMNNLHLLKSITYYIINDIQKRKMLMKLEYMSYIDLLTGVYNRNRYISDLESIKLENHMYSGVLYLDINGLKRINDSFGHRYGDYIIKKAADILCGVFSEPIYRIGGDEFVVICLDLDEDAFNQRIALLRRRLSEDSELDASIGSTWQQGTIKMDSLVNHADDLMYAEKQNYHDQHPNASNDHADAVARVISEINNERFAVFLQPRIWLSSNELAGAQALIRRQLQDGSFLWYDQFKSEFENEGVIRFIDFYALETICKALSSWGKLGEKKIRISIKLSQTTLLEPNIVESIQRVLKLHEVHPRQFCLEIDEAVSKLHINELKAVVDRFLASGFAVSLNAHVLNDLALTNEIALNEIRFDEACIQMLMSDAECGKHIRQSINMCSDAKQPQSVALGISNQEQFEQLKACGFNIGQGSYFSSPLLISQFETSCLHLKSSLYKHKK